MDEVRFVDTTIRDGQQSLWALRMRTAMMLPTLKDLDAAGFDAIEFTVPTAQFSRAVRDLREDPWDWLAVGSQRVAKTPLRLHGTARSPFLQVPQVVQELLLDRLAGFGIRYARVTDTWNNFERLKPQLDTLESYGIEAVVNLIYSISPRHTDRYYAERARAAAALRPYRICFKDPGGLLTPEVVHRLVPIVLDNAGDIPVEFHMHCSSGLGTYCTSLAVEAGIRIVHTAIPPLAEGSSLPSVFTVERNLRASGFKPLIHLDPVTRISDHLSAIAEDEKLPRGVPQEYVEGLFRHQIPGGMISNLRLHLEQAGLSERMSETLEECVRVRAELGYPIMVTPLSQFVATQAAINVMTGARYEVVTDEVIQYALGRWGHEGAEAMLPDVRNKIIDRPRVGQIADRLALQDPEPSLEQVRRRYGNPRTDEELIVRAYAGVRREDMGLIPHDLPLTYEDYRRADRTRSQLPEVLLAARSLRSVDYRAGDSAVRLMRSPADAPSRDPDR